MKSHRLWEQAQDIYILKTLGLSAERGSGHMLPPLGKKLSATGTHLQWKHSLHQWGLTPVLTTLDVRPYTQEVAKQNQHNGTFVECLSHSFT